MPPAEPLPQKQHRSIFGSVNVTGTRSGLRVIQQPTQIACVQHFGSPGMRDPHRAIAGGVLAMKFAASGNPDRVQVQGAEPAARHMVPRYRPRTRRSRVETGFAIENGAGYLLSTLTACLASSRK